MSDEYFKRSAKKNKKERSLHFSAFFAQKCHVTEDGGGANLLQIIVVGILSMLIWQLRRSLTEGS